MAEIHPLTATIATLYTNFWAFVVMCVYSFSRGWNDTWSRDGPNGTTLLLGGGINYGTALLILALTSLITGLTAGDSENPLLRAALLCLTTVWAARGSYHIINHIINNTNNTIADVPVSEVLFPGYGAFLFVFLIFSTVALFQRSRHVAIISFCFSLICVFEIVSMWHPLYDSLGAYYVILGIVMLYNFFRCLVKRKAIAESETVKEKEDRNLSVDYVVVGNAMNVVCSVVFASHVTGITLIPSNAFIWVVIAGLMQTVCGVVSVRRQDTYHGCHFSLYGVFWLALGFNLGVEFFLTHPVPPLVAVFIFFIVVYFCAGIFSATKELFLCIQNIVFCVFCVALCTDGMRGQFLGAMAWLIFILSLYGLAAHLTRVTKCKVKMPLGRHLFESTRIQQVLVNRLRCCASCIYGKLREPKQKEEKGSDVMLGYSKYADLDMVGFFTNAVAGLAILWVPNGCSLLTLPWVLGIGGLVQFLVGCISFSRGKTFESCAFIVFGTLWLIWGTARGVDYYEGQQCVAVAVGCIAYLVVGLLLLLMSAVVSKAWFVTTLLFDMVVIAFLVDSLQIQATHSYEVVVMIVFAAVTFYCFTASALKAIWGRELLPLGNPIFNVSYLHAHSGNAIWANARRDTGVSNIAEILNRGGICGIPSDVVYILVAAAKFPQAVERAYNTKKQAEERPMSLWISSLKQIEAGRSEFGELTWALMKEVWPSTISLVVNKGAWLETLGIGEAEKYIGRPDSIAVRMPDNTVTTHLMDKTGPLAVTSANPTGEADTTHHLQVLAKLGLKNCDGILCDGPSHENAASTVVDCRKINEGKIGFFRVGIVPKSRVQDIFETVQRRFEQAEAIKRRTSVASCNTSSADSGVDDQYQCPSNHGSQKGSRKGSRKDSRKNSRKDSRKGKKILRESRIEGTVNPAYIDDDDPETQTESSTVQQNGNMSTPPEKPLQQRPASTPNSIVVVHQLSKVPLGPRTIRRRDSTSGESDIIDMDAHSSSSEETQTDLPTEIINQEDVTSSL